MNSIIIIKNKNIKQNQDFTKHFSLHIEELSKTGLIRPSNSPLVKNHGEILHEISRMVIDYRRLNDNIADDAYIIPDRDYLQSHIQNVKYFSKFDCKSDFHQIKVSER